METEINEKEIFFIGHNHRTYTYGYSLLSTKVIQKKDFVLLCELLATEFNKYYNTNTYSFEPEAISEGGIVFGNFRGDNNNPKFKTMRLHTITELGKYGWINKNVMEEWKNSEDILCNNNQKIGTTLKAFYGAPLWTINELKMFEKCFNIIGWKIVSSYPTKEDLISDW